MYRQTTQTETKHCKTPQFGRLSLQNCDALCESKHVQMFSDNSRYFKKKEIFPGPATNPI